MNTTFEGESEKTKKKLDHLGELKQIPMLKFCFNIMDDETENYSKSEKWFTHFIETLEKLDPMKLRDLELKFDDEEFLGDAHLLKLANMIKKKTYLRRLALNFSSCTKITDAGFKEFCGILAQTAWFLLEEFSLQFQGTKLTSVGVADLSEIYDAFGNKIKSIWIDHPEGFQGLPDPELLSGKGGSETHKWKKEVEEDYTEWNKELKDEDADEEEEEELPWG